VRDGGNRFGQTKIERKRKWKNGKWGGQTKLYHLDHKEEGERSMSIAKQKDVEEREKDNKEIRE